MMRSLTQVMKTNNAATNGQFVVLRRSTTDFDIFESEEYMKRRRWSQLDNEPLASLRECIAALRSVGINTDDGWIAIEAL